MAMPFFVKAMQELQFLSLCGEIRKAEKRLFDEKSANASEIRF